MILSEFIRTEGFCSFLCPMFFTPYKTDRWLKIIVSVFYRAVLAA